MVAGVSIFSWAVEPYALLSVIFCRLYWMTVLFMHQQYVFIKYVFIFCIYTNISFISKYVIKKIIIYCRCEGAVAAWRILFFKIRKAPNVATLSWARSHSRIMRGKSRVPRMCTETKLLLDMCLALEGIIKPNFHSTLVELQINSIFPQLPEEGYGPFLLCSKKKSLIYGV